MAKYVFRNGQLVDKQTGKPMELGRTGRLSTPAVVSDIEPYRSPVDGSVVSGRAGRREDLKKNNCVDANELDRGGRAPEGKFRNKRFAEKHNLQLSEDA